MDDNQYTGIHVLNVTTTIIMANNVNQHSSKELHAYVRTQKPTSLPLLYATGHVSLHDRPRHFVRRKAINLCVQHANQSEKSRLQPKYSSQQQTFERAQESHENSPKSLVESNLRSVHNYLGQNNETVKK